VVREEGVHQRLGDDVAAVVADEEEQRGTGLRRRGVVVREDVVGEGFAVAGFGAVDLEGRGGRDGAQGAGGGGADGVDGGWGEVGPGGGGGVGGERT
jgi:hypothetical protein